MIILDNLQMKNDLLFSLGIPFVIQNSRIGRITVEIPIAIHKTPVKINIENVDINFTGFTEDGQVSE